MPRLLLAAGTLLPILLIAPVCADKPRPEGAAEAITFAATDWPWWRGPNRNGVADAQPDPPLKWSDCRERPVEEPGSRSRPWFADRGRRPGVPGHGRPRAQQVQAVLCCTGKPANCSGRPRSIAAALTRGQRQKLAGLLHGRPATASGSSSISCTTGPFTPPPWPATASSSGRRRSPTYVVHQGYGSSPAVYESLVIVSADNKGGGAIAGLDRATGKVVWKQDRPEDAELRLADHPERGRPRTTAA